MVRRYLFRLTGSLEPSTDNRSYWLADTWAELAAIPAAELKRGDLGGTVDGRFFFRAGAVWREVPLRGPT